MRKTPQVALSNGKIYESLKDRIKTNEKKQIKYPLSLKIQSIMAPELIKTLHATSGLYTGKYYI